MKASLKALTGREDVRSLFAMLGEGNIRLVGGAVRDALLDLEVKDIDVASRLSPDEVIARLVREGVRVVPTGLAHGTVSAWVEGTRFEITQLRRDEETDGRHARVEAIDDWDEDAVRRDFTVNALYLDGDGVLHDPFDGVADLKAKRIRFIGESRERIREDYLRILRFFRFTAGYGGARPDAEGLSACEELREGLSRISGERIDEELSRILMLPRGGDALEWMESCGVLRECLGDVRLERYKALIEIESSLGLESDAGLRLGVLLHDEKGVRDVGERLRFSRVYTRRLTMMFSAMLSNIPSDLEVRGLLYRYGRSSARDILLLSWSNGVLRDNVQEWKKALEGLEGEIPNFPLTGSMVMDLGVKEGELVGKVLSRVESRWISGGFKGDSDWAVQCAREEIASLGNS
ncbi:MAG: CCA tRNA nucleotidyltransferase [Hyphomicrobiales bacterium]|nr:CCA tRNA nucleotidyltransferase [Hyphomicrobiales bacterium]